MIGRLPRVFLSFSYFDDDHNHDHDTVDDNDDDDECKFQTGR